MSIPIIILAAGASKRLGRPKQLEPIAGIGLLARTVSSALSSGVGQVIVVLGDHQKQIISEVKSLNQCTIIINPNWELGMGSSLAYGLMQIVDDQPPAVIVSVCDQPFLSKENFIDIINTYDNGEKTIVLSKYLKFSGPPALFGKAYFSQLAQLDGDDGGKSIINENQENVLFISFKNGYLDIDNQQDLDTLNINDL